MGKNFKRIRENAASESQGQSKHRIGHNKDKPVDGNAAQTSLPSWVQLGATLFVPGLCKGGYKEQKGRLPPQDTPCGECTHSPGAHMATTTEGPLHKLLVAMRNLRLSLIHRHPLAGVSLPMLQCSDDAVADRLKKANRALSAVSQGDSVTMVEAIMSLDELYYRVYYASIAGGLRAPTGLEVPTPAEWFTVWVWDPVFMCPCITKEERDAYAVGHITGPHYGDANPLLRLWSCIMYGSRWLFGTHDDETCSQTSIDRTSLVCTTPESCIPSGASGTP
eukprot:2212928-Pyramimonas_sp.AAC.3